MITQNNIDNLYKISSNLAKKDYLAMNPKNKNGMSKYKKHRPYSLSDETIEATELLKIAYKLSKVTKEEEEQIKSYLLKIKMIMPDLLEENSNFRQWKNASNHS